MKKPLFALVLSLMLLLTACAPGQAPKTSPAPEPESPSASVSEPAPEPEPAPESAPESQSSQPEPEPESTQPEEPSSEPSGPWENPDTTRNPDTAFGPNEQPPASDPTESPRYLLREYLKTALTTEEYTSFYVFYVAEKEGLGILTPNVDRVKEVVAAYDGPSIDVEYHEVPISKARQDAAREAYRDLQKRLRDTSEPLIANSGTYGLPDDPEPGKIHIEIHQMHPALQEFLDTDGYGDCFVVTVTGADAPIINPDT